MTFSVRVCFDDFCYRRHLWSDFRHRRIGSHRFGVLNLSTLRLVNHRFLGHHFLGHRDVLGRVDHFFVAVGDPGESLLAESILLL